MRQAVQQALGGRNLQDLSQEERQKMFAEFRQRSGAGGEGIPGGREGQGRGRPSPPGEPGAGPPAAPMVIQFGRGGGPGARADGQDPEMPSLSLTQSAGWQFTDQDRQNAELPAAPEEHSLMDVLLRPGLLVEAEIIVEKIPNAVYVPQQAIFEKGDKTLVYVRTDNGFLPRTVKLGKRTESQVAVVEGLGEGEWIALVDPEAGRAKPSKEDREAGREKQQPAIPSQGADRAGAGERGGQLR